MRNLLLVAFVVTLSGFASATFRGPIADSEWFTLIEILSFVKEYLYDLNLYDLRNDIFQSTAHGICQRRQSTWKISIISLHFTSRRKFMKRNTQGRREMPKKLLWVTTPSYPSFDGLLQRFIASANPITKTCDRPGYTGQYCEFREWWRGREEDRGEGEGEWVHFSDLSTDESDDRSHSIPNWGEKIDREGKEEKRLITGWISGWCGWSGKLYSFSRDYRRRDHVRHQNPDPIGW